MLTHPENPENAGTLTRLTGWLGVTDNITWREYYGLCQSFPRPIDAVALQDWRYLNRLGIDWAYSEMRLDLPSVERYGFRK